MSYKVVRRNGIVVACGPNEDFFQPVIEDGDVLTIENELPEISLSKQFTSLEFLDLFTETEQLAVVTAAMHSAQVKLWYDRTLAAMFITLADPRTEAGLAALVDAGMLTAERKDEIVEAML